MKRKFIEIFGILASFMLFFAGCSADAISDKIVEVTSVTLDEGTERELKKGESVTLHAKVSPSDATNKTVTWDSSDPEVATVDGNGKVVAIKAGRTTITVTSKSSTSKKATCAVTVTDNNDPKPNPATQYTVKFDLNGGTGTAPASITKDEGTAITLPTTTSTKTGFKFNGWSESTTATSGSTGSYTVSKNVTLYAVWIAENAKTYKVSFMNGTTELSSSNVPENTSVTKPTDPVQKDYTFANWYSDSACTTEFNFSSKITAETKIYAKFTPTEYTITYKNADGTTISGLTPTSYTVEDSVTLPTPTKEGYTFKGWYTDSGLTTAASTSGMSGNKTFYAKWEADTPTPPTPSGATYTLTASGGSAVNPDNYFTLGNSVVYTGDLIKTNSGFEVTFTTNGNATVTVVARAKTDNTTCGWKISKDGTDVFTSATYSSTTDFNTQTATLSDAGTYKMVRTGNEGVIQSITVTEASGTPLVKPTAITLNKTELNSDLATSTENTTETLTATLTPAAGLSEGWDEITWTTSNSSVASLSAASGSSVTVTYGATKGSATITAKTKNNLSATCSVKVVNSSEPEPTNVIRASDVPDGWANPKAALSGGRSISNPTNWGGYSGSLSGTTVTNRTQLLNAVKSGGIIYVNGMIDMTEGMLPPPKGTTNSHSDSYSTQKLDDFIKDVAKDLTASSYGDVATKVTSYKTWKEWYAANVKSSADQSGVAASAQGQMQNAWKKQIQLSIPSNTTIIGIDENSGIRGGTISINGVSNVVVRNLKIQDAYDPFPKMEKGDGYNAEWDGVVIDSSTYVWIDHCTFEDTITKTDSDFDHVTPSDGATAKNKWQTYDGLLDVKKGSDFITMSYNKFANHDKTSIFGHSDGQTSDEKHLTVTQHHNYYMNCTQRLPRVRYASMHSYNNYYANPSGGRSSSYCLGVAYKAKIYAEANYFDSTVAKAADNMDSSGKIYIAASNVDKSKNNYANLTSSDVGWNPSAQYDYTPDNAADLPTLIPDNAGAGKWTVER